MKIRCNSCTERKHWRTSSCPPWKKTWLLLNIKKNVNRRRFKSQNSMTPELKWWTLRASKLRRLTLMFIYTVESRFLKPPRETKIGSRNREFEISRVELQWNKSIPREMTFGSSYRVFWEIVSLTQGSRNWDSTVKNKHGIRYSLQIKRNDRRKCGLQDGLKGEFAQYCF